MLRLFFLQLSLLIPIGCLIAQAEQDPHPRILLTKKGEAKLQQTIKSDPLAGKLYTELLRRADYALTLPVCRYHLRDGKRLLPESRHALSNILHCGLAWRLSGKRPYFNRTIKEMEAACAMQHWNTTHFLDTAEMSTAVAIGYDWLYPNLSEPQRKKYAAALREKGLLPAREGFSGKLSWWATPRNNWAQVCSTGLLYAERALEKNDDPIHPARTQACKTLKACRSFYQPGGAYPEGPAYWHYGSNYHVMGLALHQQDKRAILQIPSPPEFKTSVLFPDYLTAPSGKVFNFADASAQKSRISSAQLWMANTFKQPATSQWVRTKISKDIAKPQDYPTFGTERFFPLSLLWLPPQPQPSSKVLALDSYWQGEQPIASFRTSWVDPNALFFAIKGGYPAASHGQMDVGSFVIDSDGIRWALDLGKDNYNLPGYFGKQRWSYFRLTNHSHNTLVIGDQLQNAKASPCKMSGFLSTPTRGEISINLTSAYAPQAKKIVRHCQFDRIKKTVTLTDTLEQVKEPVRWAILTRSSIHIKGKTVILSRAGKKLEITREDDNGGKWQISDATPATAAEQQNEGIRVLSFTAPAKAALTLSVTFKKIAP